MKPLQRMERGRFGYGPDSKDRLFTDFQQLEDSLCTPTPDRTYYVTNNFESGMFVDDVLFSRGMTTGSLGKCGTSTRWMKS